MVKFYMNQIDSKNKYPELAKEWLLRAQDDELSAKDILDDRQGAPTTVCFLSQQIAEKSLKAFLCYQGIEFPKIHQLDELLKLCERVDADFNSLIDIAEDLTPFYISTRYPGDYPMYSFQDAESAFQKSIIVKDFVLKRLFF